MPTPSKLKAVAVAQLAAKSNKALYPQPNTPLEIVSRSNYSATWSFDYLGNSPDQEQANGVASALDIGDQSDPIGEAELTVFTEQISQAVQNHINYAKNVVLPELKEFVQIVSARMSEPQTIISGFQLDISDIPAPMANAGFKQRISEYQGGTYANPNIQLKLPMPEVLEEAFMTGSNDFDASIKQWLNGIGQDQVAQMWKDVYTDEGRAKDLVEFFEDGGGIDYAIFVWLSLGHLMENPPEGVAYTLQELQRFGGQYLETAAIRIQKEYNVVEQHSAAQLMVVGQDKYANKLTVNGPVYREFVKNGGKNEALLGGMLGGNLGKTLPEVEANAGEYYAEYERNEALQQSLRRNDAFNVFKSALVWGISSLKYDSLTEEEKTAWTEMNINITAVLDRAKTVVEELYISDMDNVYATCMKVLCRSRYQYTDAEYFLTSMDNAMKANPNMDVREAGLVATIEKIGDYLADQIMIRKV